MSRRMLSTLAVFACIMPGCTPGPSAPAPAQDPVYRTAQRPKLEPTPRRDVITDESDQGQARFTGVTDADRRFAEFLREKSAGMVRQASVNAQEEGLIRVQLGKSVAPDETLPLTKSLMAGARKDFPNRRLILSVYDPNGDPILKARYLPGHGVDYRIAQAGDAPTRRDGSPRGEGPARPDDRERRDTSSADSLSRGGVTAADRKFSEWAEDHGKAFLRYVQADLERNGRLWFGVTAETKPADVPELTRSLLQGARKEFPRRELIATVFDPEGERIGKARLGDDGRLTWEK